MAEEMGVEMVDDGGSWRRQLADYGVSSPAMDGWGLEGSERDLPIGDGSSTQLEVDGRPGHTYHGLRSSENKLKGSWGVVTHKDIMWGLVILGSLVHSALGLQEFLETPSYSEVNPGTRLVLPCFVKDKGGECRWEKDGNPVGIFEDKYEWAGNLNKGNCSLAILDASSEYDDGVWQCQVIDCSKYLVQ